MTNLKTNKAIVQSYVTAMNAGDIAALKDLFAPDAEIQGVTGKGTFDFAARVWHDLHHGLNMRLDVQAIVAEGDTVSVRYVESGRWTGPFLDFKEPTGRAFELVAIEWFEIHNGKITRRWGVRDSGSQARQVGFPAVAGGHTAVKDKAA